jgi:hypothetical protein
MLAESNMKDTHLIVSMNRRSKNLKTRNKTGADLFRCDTSVNICRNNNGDNTNNNNAYNVMSQVQFGLSLLHYRQCHVDAFTFKNGFASIFSCPFLLTRLTVS